MTLPKDSKERKTYPMFSGLFEYFPAALAAVAHVSHVGNEQHNPGQPHHDNREKSNDDYDCMLRHLSEASEDDEDGLLHAAKVAWRALRACQKILEAKGASPAPAARWPSREQGFTVSPGIGNRVGGTTPLHQDLQYTYYNWDPDEAIEDCAFHLCDETIKSADTPINCNNKSYCSVICAVSDTSR